ncbi:MAG: hypothetical protein JW795_12705 [Chitinivibrionales bacterium]|nr:hypothetical protein [Chitinivibrionales bacterium]
MGTRNYSLACDTRVYSIDDNEIRFRKGIWNYIEAIITLHDQSDFVQKVYRSIANDLINHNKVNIDEYLQAQGVTDADKVKINENIDSLDRQGFIIDPDNAKLNDIISVLMAGRGIESSFISNPMPVLFISNNQYAKDLAKDMCAKMKFPLDILDDETYSQIQKADLITKSDAPAYLQLIDQFKSQFKIYSAIAVSFTSPNMMFMRNLNRICIETGKALIGGMIDGPFISMFGMISPKTGCFECLEHRALARQRDTMSYINFVKASAQQNTAQVTQVGFLPFINMYTSFVLSECFLFSALKISRLAGRVLNLYMPVLEFQAQDLLRIPYCPACGSVTKSRMDDMYTSSKAIVDEMLKKIELEV